MTFVDDILNFSMPRYKQLPDLDLYMDQLINYIETTLSPLKVSPNEKLITTAMVNNYVKQKIVPATHKKRYSRNHIAYLLVVCIFKQVYSIQEISDLIKIQIETFDVEVAYDYFCTELERILYSTFTNSPLPEDTSVTKKEQRIFVRNSVISFATKLNIQKILHDINKEAEN